MTYEESKHKMFCVNGDIKSLLSYLENCPLQQDLYQQYHQIFVQEPSVFHFPTDHLQINEILNVYYQYYVYVFGQSHTPEEGKIFLYQTFKKLFPSFWLRNINMMEYHIKRKMKQYGYHFLGGTTQVFYGPYIWKTTEKNTYIVDIPSGTIKVKVFFMKEFISNSWLWFLSMGKTGTGGWTKRQGLFCKWDSYQGKLDQPTFQISFLKHEAQHLADFRKYHHKLSQTQLEYRAKLCELSYYPTIDLFAQFLLSAKDDPNYAHSQAAYWIVSDLSKILFNENDVHEIESWQGRIDQIKVHCKKMLLEENRIK